MWAPTNPGWFTMTVLLAAEIYVNVNVISINTVGGGKLKFVGFFFVVFVDCTFLNYRFVNIKFHWFTFYE